MPSIPDVGAAAADDDGDDDEARRIRLDRRCRHCWLSQIKATMTTTTDAAGWLNRRNVADADTELTQDVLIASLFRRINDIKY
jgi:hypothetical protein